MRAVWMLVGVLAAAGCASSPRYGKYDLNVTLDDSLRQPNKQLPTMDVDLVAVGEFRRSEWTDKSIDEYFSPRDQFRAQEREAYSIHTMSFRGNGPATQTLSRKDLVWNKWRGRPELFIIADLRGVTDRDDQKGTQRRLVLPLDTSRWAGSTINVRVRRDRIISETEPRPPKS